MWKPTSLLLLSNLCFLSKATQLPALDLSNAENQNKQLLFDDGGQLGAFVVTNLGSKYAQAVDNVIANAPHCLAKEYPALPKFQMNDGSTRTTFASTIDHSMPSCLSEDLEIVVQAFDQVQDIVGDIVNNITGEIVTYQDDKGRQVDLKSSPIKEHLHVYHKDSLTDHEDEHWMVPFHVDNGLFLLLTPFPGHGLKIKTSTGVILDTDNIPTDCILVLMGRGLTDWLLNEDKRTLFHAVPHAVESKSRIHSRSVFARMKVAPLDALSMDQALTFHDVFFNNDAKVLVKRNDKSEVIHDDKFAAVGEAMCKEGEAYCWMQECMPYPHCNANQVLSCYSTEHNVTCCSDPNVECQVMDDTCNWECLDNPTSNNNTNDFCSGGMDMLMSGFATTQGTKTCIILFFRAWTLDTRFKFVIGCFGVAWLGFAIELLIAIRRRVSGRKGFIVRLTPLARRLLVIVLFALNLIMGYLAMLVAMTYSIELFLCVVFGLCLGHAVFNAKSAVGESIDPCCASQQHQQLAQIPISRTPCDAEIQIDSDNEELCASNCPGAATVAAMPSSNSNPPVVVNFCDKSKCNGSNGSTTVASSTSLNLPKS